MIFRGPIDSIGYDDVVRFCEQGVEESSVLEYKSALPTNESLAKTISAFANTYGGVLIVGVDAKNGIPTPPFTGVQLDPKIAERIEAISLANLKEPVFPEIRVCPSSTGPTGFVIVRVGESPNAPHRYQNRRVYVRTGQSSTPTDEADWERTQWLVARREKSLSAKEQLRLESERQYENALSVRAVAAKDSDAYFGLFTIRCTPTFPHGPVTHLAEMERLVSTLQVSTDNSTFPPHGVSDAHLRAVPNGVQAVRFYEDRFNQPVHGKPFTYLYSNTFGLLMFKQPLGFVFQQEKWIDFFQIFITVPLFMAVAYKLFKAYGFFGSVDLYATLDDVHGVKAENPGTPPRADEKTLVIEADNIRSQRTLSVHELAQSRRDVAASILHEMAWAFGARRVTEEGLLKQMDTTLKTRGKRWGTGFSYLSLFRLNNY